MVLLWFVFEKNKGVFVVYNNALTHVSSALSSMGDKNYLSFAFSGIGSLLTAVEIATVSRISFGTALNGSALVVSVAGIIYGVVKNIFEALSIPEDELKSVLEISITAFSSLAISPFLMQRMGVVKIAEEGVSALLVSFLGGFGMVSIAISVAMLVVPLFIMLQDMHALRLAGRR